MDGQGGGGNEQKKEKKEKKEEPRKKERSTDRVRTAQRHEVAETGLGLSEGGRGERGGGRAAVVLQQQSEMLRGQHVTAHTLAAVNVVLHAEVLQAHGLHGSNPLVARVHGGGGGHVSGPLVERVHRLQNARVLHTVLGDSGHGVGGGQGALV